MKTTIATLVFLMAFVSLTPAQSKSYRLLKEKFSGSENVYSLRTSGFLARTILRMTGEHEYNDAIRNVRSIRLIVIPKDAFRKQDVTLQGFRKVAKEDGFEELAHVRDHGDDVSILIQTPAQKNLDNRYLLLIEEKDEVVVIEVRGYIDPDLIFKHKDTLAYN
jgi:hypothetical protein